MPDVVVNESLIFDACALIEQIRDVKYLGSAQTLAMQAEVLLNKALNDSEQVNS